MTDGVVLNTDSIVELIKKYAGTTKIFSVGISHSASKRMVRNLSLAGSGKYDTIEDGENLLPKLEKMVKLAIQPAIIDVSLYLRLF